MESAVVVASAKSRFLTGKGRRFGKTRILAGLRALVASPFAVLLLIRVGSDLVLLLLGVARTYVFREAQGRLWAIILPLLRGWSVAASARGKIESVLIFSQRLLW